MDDDSVTAAYVPDSISLDRLDCVYPDVRTRWLRLASTFYEQRGLSLRVAQGLRTYADQQKIYEKGRELIHGKWMPEKPGDISPFTGRPYDHHRVVSWAKPGDSWHHFSAIDSCFRGKDPYLDHHPERDYLWAEYARIAKGFGFEAGYDWPEPKQDIPHIQLRYGGMTLAEAKHLFSKGGLLTVWRRFDFIRGVPEGSDWMTPQIQQKLRNLSAIA